jgi:Ni,Fe-hydrogenase III large subunit/Ni,Fe-hydrogenase III component G
MNVAMEKTLSHIAENTETETFGTMEKTHSYIPENTKTEIFGNAIAFEIVPSEIIKVIRKIYKDASVDLKLITATDERKEHGCFKIWYIFGNPDENVFIIPYIRLPNTNEFPSLTPIIHQAWNHERKIRSFFGLIPVGHPDTRPIILHENWPIDEFPLRKDFDWNTRPPKAQGTYHFQKITGDSIYEIPVGPVHAGIIEPGHFRFSVAGEEIMLLEPRLGFTHKGCEKLFEQLSLKDKIRLSEKLSGDSSFSHSLAFCQALEQLATISVPKRASYLRLIYAELERLANHFGDIGALMLDTGFNFGGSHGARLREMIMRINDRLTGSRFLRGVNVFGGVARDIDSGEAELIIKELENIAADFSEIIETAEGSASLFNRMKSTGELPLDVAKDHGVVGVTARAVGIARDTRIDFPYAAYSELGFNNVDTEQGGDVYARFSVRVKEVHSSILIIKQALRTLPEGPICTSCNDVQFTKNIFTVGIVEGWRGDIVYFITTDEMGNISRVAPRDPSFVNWSILEYAGRGNIIPDFPLINKSFNLSYSGNDL